MSIFPGILIVLQLEFKLRHDSDADIDGIVVAQIMAGTGYTVSSSTARFAVHDTDVVNPVTLSISRNHEAIYEGEDAIFTVSRTGDTTNSLPFKYVYSDTDDVIDGEGTVRNGEILAGQSQLVLPTLTTKTGATLTANSGVTLRLQSVLDDNTIGYRVDTQSGE